ncbi:hypothetical protein BT69DRAFT_1296700 [Atractiella rhizophila]|nr:hypothetical protein BT69DRAFT_1296700 [Atractiella rhizophila]
MIKQSLFFALLLLSLFSLSDAGRMQRKIKRSSFRKRQGGVQAVGETVCSAAGRAQLSSHDCNVALLSLGPGGIAGAIEFLRVNSNFATATSGSCTVSVSTTDGSNISISKGRLEHGGIKGFDNLIADCGATPGSVLIQGGATGGGNVMLTVSPAAA